MKLNKPLIRKMIKRIETMPESYNQGTFGERWYEDSRRPKPTCGTVACLAGEAVICSTKTLRGGVRKLFREIDTGDVEEKAAKLMGITDAQAEDLFAGGAAGWPEEFREQWSESLDYKGEARAAVNLLKAILKTDGKVLEPSE